MYCFPTSSFGQVLLVESLKDILAMDEPECDHDLVQQLLQLLLTGLFIACSQFRVDKLGNHLCRLVLPCVDEALKRVFQGNSKFVIVQETLGHNNPIQLGLEVKQLLHHGLVLLRVEHNHLPSLFTYSAIFEHSSV